MAKSGAAAQFVAFFASLRETKDVHERLVRLGLATRSGGEIVLRDDVRKPFEALAARLGASLGAGMSPREAVEAAALDVDLREVTHVVYGLFLTAGGPELYVGETVQSAAVRFAKHPAGCPKLSAWIEETGGKLGWTCAVLLVLPEDARSKELLLYLEARLQRLLDTVEGAHGLNVHYGAGTYGGAPDEDRWLARYVELIEFVAERGELPAQSAKDPFEKTLGIWANNQRRRRDKMSAHRRKALEALGSAWQWRIRASYVTNAALFAKLRADDRVKASGGMHIPSDIPGANARRVFSARQDYANKKMSEQDRAIVDSEFQGLAMTAPNASFYLNARGFAEAHPGAETLPSKNNDKAMYMWLNDLQTGNIDADAPWRMKVLEKFNLSSLLEMRKSSEVRGATSGRRKALRDERNAEVSARRAGEREEAKRRKISDLTAGPRV